MLLLIMRAATSRGESLRSETSRLLSPGSSQPLHSLDDIIGGNVDLFTRIEATNTKAKACSRQLITATDRAQNMAWLRICGRAGGTGTDGNLLQTVHQHVTIDAFKADIQIPGQSLSWMTIQVNAIEL